MASMQGERVQWDDVLGRDRAERGSLHPGSIAPVALNSLLAREPEAEEPTARSRLWLFGGLGAAGLGVVAMLIFALGSGGPAPAARAAAGGSPVAAAAVAPVAPPAAAPAPVAAPDPAPVTVVAASSPAAAASKKHAKPARAKTRTTRSGK